jgi:DNA-binding MarR family transcriptional regulator
MSNTHPNSSRRGFQDLSRALSNVHAELQQIAQEAPGATAERQFLPGRYLSEVRDTSVARAIEIYRSRRRRDAAFGEDADLFGEPAWDILLDLLDADAQGRRISVTSASLASSVPATTGLRMIAILEERGLVMRTDDPLDRRRSHVSLTGKGRAAMQAALR